VGLRSRMKRSPTRRKVERRWRQRRTGTRR
jgi:hypothetical protein